MRPGAATGGGCPRCDEQPDGRNHRGAHPLARRRSCARAQPGPGPRRAGADRRGPVLSEVAREVGVMEHGTAIETGVSSEQVFGWRDAARIAIVILAAAAAYFRIGAARPHLDLIGIVGIVIGGWPIFKEAAENLAARRMTMELSMSIAIVAAAAISEYFNALIITLFVLVAEVLEKMTVSRGRRAIRDLLEFLPHSVTLRRGDGVREASADEIRIGDSVLVNPGAMMPVDGTVISGHSFVDEARIT